MPDVELKPQVYRDERPKEFFDSFHAIVRDHPPETRVYEQVRILTQLNALITFRAHGLHSENVPNGPVILAPNHASFMDHFFAGAFIRRRVQFMGKSQLFKGVPGWIFSHGGVFPVRRGQQDEEAFTTAFAILKRGGVVVMYCEGGRSRTGKVADEARPGIGRLALESGAPIVPVAILGSHQVRNWKRLQFPKVTVSYGEPFRFERLDAPSRDAQQQVADFVLGRIRDLYGELVRQRRRPGRAADSPARTADSPARAEDSPADTTADNPR